MRIATVAGSIKHRSRESSSAPRGSVRKRSDLYALQLQWRASAALATRCGAYSQLGSRIRHNLNQAMRTWFRLGWRSFPTPDLWPRLVAGVEREALPESGKNWMRANRLRFSVRPVPF